MHQSRTQTITPSQLEASSPIHLHPSTSTVSGPGCTTAPNQTNISATPHFASSEATTAATGDTLALASSAAPSSGLDIQPLSERSSKWNSFNILQQIWFFMWSAWAWRRISGFFLEASCIALLGGPVAYLSILGPLLPKWGPGSLGSILAILSYSILGGYDWTVDPCLTIYPPYGGRLGWTLFPASAYGGFSTLASIGVYAVQPKLQLTTSENEAVTTLIISSGNFAISYIVGLGLTLLLGGDFTIAIWRAIRDSLSSVAQSMWDAATGSQPPPEDDTQDQSGPSNPLGINLSPTSGTAGTSDSPTTQQAFPSHPGSPFQSASPPPVPGSFNTLVRLSWDHLSWHSTGLFVKLFFYTIARDSGLVNLPSILFAMAVEWSIVLTLTSPTIYLYHTAQVSNRTFFSILLPFGATNILFALMVMVKLCNPPNLPASFSNEHKVRPSEFPATDSSITSLIRASSSDALQSVSRGITQLADKYEATENFDHIKEGTQRRQQEEVPDSESKEEVPHAPLSIKIRSTDQLPQQQQTSDSERGREIPNIPRSHCIRSVDPLSLLAFGQKELYDELVATPGVWRSVRRFRVVGKEPGTKTCSTMHLQRLADRPFGTPTKPSTHRRLDKRSTMAESTADTRNSLLSESTDGKKLCISVQSIQGEEVSPQLHRFGSYLQEHVNSGDILEIHPPLKDFVRRATFMQDSLIFIIAGKDNSPILSMLEDALEAGRKNVTVVDCVRPTDRFVLPVTPAVEEIRLKHKDRIKLLSAHQTKDPSDVDYQIDTSTRRQLQDYFNQFYGSHVFFQGPEPFMKSLKFILQTMQVEQGRMHHEFFGLSEDLGKWQAAPEGFWDAETPSDIVGLMSDWINQPEGLGLF